METTNYAYIRKLVKICDQLLGPCRPSNLSALVSGLVTSAASTDICFFSSEKKCNSNQFESRLHSHTVVTRFHDGHERARSAGRLVLMCDVGATMAHVWQYNSELTFCSKKL